MPSHLSWLGLQLLIIRPKSILDIGVGFGGKGMLFREYTDIWRGNYKNWKTRIDGIEVFEDYITPLQLLIYDNIYIGEATKVFEKLGNYDLIYLGDIIEHFEKSEGKRFLARVLKKAKVVIIATPSKVHPQGAVNNNEHEAHKSQWTPEDFPGAENRIIYKTLVIKYVL